MRANAPGLQVLGGLHRLAGRVAAAGGPDERNPVPVPGQAEILRMLAHNGDLVPDEDRGREEGVSFQPPETRSPFVFLALCWQIPRKLASYTV